MDVLLFLRHIWTLTAKTLRILLLRHIFSTVVRAFVIPVALFAFFSFAKYLFVPPAVYGIGTLRPLLSLHDALADAATTGRHTVAFYNGGFAGGPIDAVIDAVAAQVEAAGSRAVHLANTTELDTVCHSSLRGVTPCYGAVLFSASPSEGDAAIWTYDIRLDGSLGAGRIDVDKGTNDGEVYMLPFQHAIDTAIVGQSSSSSSNPMADADVHEYPFTSLTPKQRREKIRERYQSSLISFLAVSFISGVIGVCYHLAGFVATERETGMSTLLDAMMATTPRGRRLGAPQIARLAAYHVSFSLVYLPGWIFGSAIVAASVFSSSNAAVTILYHILVGLTLASMALMGSSVFRRAQLSGVSVTIVYLALAILAQTITSPNTVTVVVLSFFFAPCNYVFFLTYVARFERHRMPANLLEDAPNSPWKLPGIVFWLFLALQLVVYPIIGAAIERYLFGTATSGRTVETRAAGGGVGGVDEDEHGQARPALQLEAFSKTYAPGKLRRAFGWVKAPRPPVHAVRELTLSAVHGEILVLLGANGSGKSTTLDVIAGTSRLTSGRITLDGSGGLGIAPQKNVLWDDLTVEEHLRIFNRLKTPRSAALATPTEITQLVASVDLAAKAGALSKTLSGGQQRKLQLGMMLTGGSAVCCVDEVSSGLDPLSRRKIWDILLAERGRRTIVMTTHFLDEADLLADHIAVLSRGTLRAQGSAAALKERLGGGYRIHVHKARETKEASAATAAAAVTVRSANDLPDVDGVAKKDAFDMVTYVAPSSRRAAEVVRTLEAAGVTDYRFSGPTLEDVFLQLAEEAQEQDERGEREKTNGTNDTNGLNEVNEINEADEADEADETSLNTSSRDGIVEHQASGTAAATASAHRAASKKSLADTSTTSEEKGACQAMPLEVPKVIQDPRKGTSGGLKLLSGRRISYWQQTRVLFLKRFVVFQSNWFPSLVAFALPVIAAGLVSLFVKNQKAVGCSSADQLSVEQPENLAEVGDLLFFVAGPPARFSDIGALVSLFGPVFGSSSGGSGGSSDTSIVGDLFNNITLADTFDDFNNLIVEFRKNVTPAGIWLGDATSPPTVAYLGDYLDQVNAFFGQNILDVMLANTSIAAKYAEFNIPWSPSTGKSLQLLVYVCLACAAYPGFFALYPNLERRRHVRGLEYSNGVRALPLWLAYVAFDFCLVLGSSALVTILFDALSDVWYHVGYLFIVFALYGLASALLAYVISLYTRSQLSAYAFTAAYQAVMFLVYMIAYLATITYAPVNHIDSYLLVVHFVVSAVAPIGSVLRAMFVTLNLFSVSCVGRHISDNPGAITLYGGPILYLFWQTFVLFGVLLWVDSGSVGATVHRLLKKVRGPTRRCDAARDGAEAAVDAVPLDCLDGVDGVDGVDGAKDLAHGLHVSHVTKTFKRNTAVDNVSFDVGHGEVFALLGPNGAGKSTTISMIRGDVKPDDGDVWVEGASVTRQLAAVRGSLGVCPQFDAIDQMTVRAHLRFYARVRGIADVEHNVRAVVRAVGLSAFADRPAHSLSGGNKRKLSLGIALMGNPAVVLLDEPSSGLDAAAKRIMWRTLAATAPGRSILLTTHSMEEADALAGRAGILAGRMLAAGATDDLRARFGCRLYVHLVCRGAPRTPAAATARLRQWVQATFAGVAIEDETYHGQMRFAIPLDAAGSGGDEKDVSPAQNPQSSGEESTDIAGSTHGTGSTRGTDGRLFSTATASAIGRLVVLLDEQRDALGIDHYSVSPTTLDQVFLEIVGRHNVEEEGYHRREGEAAAAAVAAGRRSKGWKFWSK